MYYDLLLHLSWQYILDGVRVVEEKFADYRKHCNCGYDAKDNLAWKEKRDEDLIIFADGIKAKFD